MKKAALVLVFALVGLGLSACWDHGHPHSPGDRPGHHHGHDHDGEGSH